MVMSKDFWELFERTAKMSQESGVNNSDVRELEHHRHVVRQASVELIREKLKVVQLEFHLLKAQYCLEMTEERLKAHMKPQNEGA